MAVPIITTLGLCAGVGMLDLGLHIGLEYLGFHPIVLGYVERDAYAASRLLERMEEQALEPAPVWAGNLQDVRWERWAGIVDCIVAGFPCQPHSMAGSRKGTDDSRWIWPAIAECIRVVRPSLVYLENVSGLRSSGGMAPVLADLAALGFRVEWDSIRASDVGASHQRERVFILGYAGHHARDAECRKQSEGAASGPAESNQMGREPMADQPQHGWLQGRPESSREQGRPDAEQRDGAVGNAGCVQRIPGYVEGRSGSAEEAEHKAHDQSAYGDCSLGDTESQRLGEARSSGRARVSGVGEHGSEVADTGCPNDERRSGSGEIQSPGRTTQSQAREWQRRGHDAGNRHQHLADASQPRREGREQPGTHVADGRTDGFTI